MRTHESEIRFSGWFIFFLRVRCNMHNSVWAILPLLHCLSHFVWHLTVDSNSGTFYSAQLSTSKCKLRQFQRTVWKWLEEILLINFERNINSYLRTNQAVKKECHFCVFPSNFRVLDTTSDIRHTTLKICWTLMRDDELSIKIFNCSQNFTFARFARKI